MRMESSEIDMRHMGSNEFSIAGTNSMAAIGEKACYVFMRTTMEAWIYVNSSDNTIKKLRSGKKLSTAQFLPTAFAGDNCSITAAPTSVPSYLHHLSRSCVIETLIHGKVDVSSVVYRVGECMQELIKLWKEYESSQAEKIGGSAHKWPTLEILIPAEHVTARQVKL